MELDAVILRFSEAGDCCGLFIKVDGEEEIDCKVRDDN
jgi:hypothetical protein